MSVNINLGNSVIFTVPVDSKSGFLYGICQDQNVGNMVTVDLKMLLKRATDISLTNYVYFLTHSKTDANFQSVIFDQSLMVDCLDIYNITGDDNYFNYLLSQLHKFWTLLLPILYSSDFDIDVNVMWDIHLHTPHQLLPKKFVNNKLFYDNWLQLNTGREITLNGFEVKLCFTLKNSIWFANVGDPVTNDYRKSNGDQKFIYKVIKYPSGDTNTMTIYSDVNNNSKTEKEMLTNNNNGDIEVITYYNSDIQGYVTNTSLDRLMEISTVINDKFNGPYYRYYNNGKLRNSTYYLDGRRWGTETFFDENGNIEEENIYHNNIITSTRNWLIDNGQNRLLSETHFASELPKEIRYYYLSGNYIVCIFPTTSEMLNEDNWVFVDGETMTLYDTHNKPIWEICYGKPTKQYFFNDGKIVDNNIRDTYEIYDYINEQWRHSDLVI